MGSVAQHHLCLHAKIPCAYKWTHGTCSSVAVDPYRNTLVAMQGESKLGGTNVTLLMVADPGDFAGTGNPFSLSIQLTCIY